MHTQEVEEKNHCSPHYLWVILLDFRYYLTSQIHVDQDKTEAYKIFYTIIPTDCY
jgi:hypothetical protein